MKRYSIFIIILLLLPMGTAETQFIGITHTFTLAPKYELSSFTRASLIWDENSNQTISVNITITSLPDEISSIIIDAITYSIFAVDNNPKGTQINYESTTPQDTFSKVGDQMQYNHTMRAPTVSDNFFLNITLYARTSGNVTQGESKSYSYRFPENQTILVNRQNNLVPLINLYGFPPRSFFVKWLPFYLVAIVLIAFPGVISLLSRQKKGGK